MNISDIETSLFEFHNKGIKFLRLSKVVEMLKSLGKRATIEEADKLIEEWKESVK